MVKKLDSQSAIDEHIGCRIRQARFDLEITQEELAKVLGISFQQIQKYENGANGISAVRLFDICEFLNVPLQSMFPPLADRRTRPSRTASVSIGVQP